MSLSKKVCIILLALFGLLIMLLKVLGITIFPYMMILFMVFIIMIAIGNYRVKPSRSTLIKIIVYFCATIADIFLNFTKYGKVHIFLFLVVQILLCIAYISDIPYKSRDLVYLIAPIIISAVLYSVIVVPVLPHPLATAFAIYIVCLTLMIWRAFCFLKKDYIPNKQKWMLFIGSLCFYFTDVLVGVRIIYNPALINLWVYLLYPPALLLITSSDWFRAKDNV